MQEKTRESNMFVYAAEFKGLHCFQPKPIIIHIIVYLLVQYELFCKLIGSPDVYYQQIFRFRSVKLHSQGKWQ